MSDRFEALLARDKQMFLDTANWTRGHLHMKTHPIRGLFADMRFGIVFLDDLTTVHLKSIKLGDPPLTGETETFDSVDKLFETWMVD